MPTRSKRTDPTHQWLLDLRSDNFDSAVLLYRVQGATLTPIAADDYTGAIGSAQTTQDHALLFTVLPEQGQYVILATTARPLETGSYRLLVTANAVTTIQYGANLTNASFATTDVKNAAGSYFDAYSFSGQQGDRVRITVTSNAFGPFLLLNRNNGSSVNVDENDEVSPTAQIEHVLPQTGLYTILVTPYDENVTGPYTLSLQRLTGKRSIFGSICQRSRASFDMAKFAPESAWSGYRVAPDPRVFL